MSRYEMLALVGNSLMCYALVWVIRAFMNGRLTTRDARGVTWIDTSQVSVEDQLEYYRILGKTPPQELVARVKEPSQREIQSLKTQSEYLRRQLDPGSSYVPQERRMILDEALKYNKEQLLRVYSVPPHQMDKAARIVVKRPPH